MAEGSSYLSFMGLRVHYAVREPEVPVKHRVLLACSPMMTMFHWRKLMPELSLSGCLTVLVELPGFGASACGAEIPQNTAMRSNILWGVLDEVDEATDAPMSTWHLIGHGSACPTLAAMAEMVPDSVRSEVYISPLFSMRGSPFDRMLEEDWFDEVFFAHDNFCAFAEYLAAYPMEEYVLERMRRPFLREGAKACFQQAIRASQHGFRRMAHFSPTMVLMGGKDPLLTEERRAQITGLLPDAETHLLKSAGHFPTETHSKALRDYLRGWLKYNE